MRRALTIVAIALALGLVGAVVFDSQPAFAWGGCGPAWGCPVGGPGWACGPCGPVWACPPCGPAFYCAPYGCAPAWCSHHMKWKKRHYRGKGKHVKPAKPMKK
jgi:hypothetical protein